MARLARIVIPGTPHFITQKGNRDLNVFFDESDAHAYIEYLSEQSERFGLQIWAYCLLHNRVHLLAVPYEENSLASALGEAHRRYTNRINEQKGWQGHLWAARFSSFPIDDPYILPAAHFIEMSPVMNGTCKSPEEFKWSSARAHLSAKDDALCKVAPLLSMNSDWDALLDKGINIDKAKAISAHIRTGRPLGDDAFISKLEQLTGRVLKKKKPGRKRKMVPANSQRQRLLVPENADAKKTRISEDVLAALIESA